MVVGGVGTGVMGSNWVRALVFAAALFPLVGSSARGQFHTVRFLDPSAVPDAHLPDTGGILVGTSHNFQEDGVHVEAIWVPSTHVGFTQGHFHHLENGFETSHGFGSADAEGWYDLQGFYLRMVDGSPFTLVSIDYRLRVDLQTTDILVATDLDPALSFASQFVHHPVGRFSTFQTQTFSGFENLTEVFISSILSQPNLHQIQWDNIVVYTTPPVYGACCPAKGIGCSQETLDDCAAEGGTYLGDNTPCIEGGFCPTRAGACCASDGSMCAMKSSGECAKSGSVFAGLGTACEAEGACPLDTGKCCVENGANCLQILEAACVGENTFFHGAGSLCVEGGECFVPCDIDADCDDAEPCNGAETCDVASGQCQTGTPPTCDDSNACTMDSCAAGVGCAHVAVGCNDSDPCTTDSCDPAIGCVHTPAVCTDADVCNGLETCNPETGECQPGNILDCDDDDACTTDSCDAIDGCEHQTVVCDDAVLCTNDSCDLILGCVFQPVICDDQNFCNGLEFCNPKTGSCVVGEPLNCEDDNACTLDKCSPSEGCIHFEFGCDDDDPCTVDSCDELEGCVYTPIVCDDGDVCNGQEVCGAKSGQCQAGTPLDCDDNNACTGDACDSLLGCQHSAVVCIDEIHCTTDLCDPALGCVFEPIDCDDGDACNGAESCEELTGECLPGADLDCDDLDACTVDHCDPVLGCVHMVASCDDADFCTTDACDPVTGCTHAPVECDNGDVCDGVESCDSVDGECVAGPPLDCDDQDACTTDTCDSLGGCQHVTLICGDADPCTTDSCNGLLGCVFAPIVCDDGNACNGLEVCDSKSGACELGTPPDCDDLDACTIDACDALAGCLHAPVVCDDFNPCTADICDPLLGCVFTAVVCDDGDACNGVEVCNAKTGVCEPGAPLNCDDDDACTLDACAPLTGCSHATVACDDGNACTTDSCDVARGCQFSPVICDDADLCTIDTCDPLLGCIRSPVVCDNADVCDGLETCEPLTGQCQVGVTLECDDADACTVDQCDALLGCVYTPRVCDDGDACTIDACDSLLGCSHTAVVCDDGNVCNGLETCNLESGACDAGVALVCDDGDACTTDACDPKSGCLTTPRTCDDDDPCTVDSCDSQLGCLVEQLCDTGYACDGGECACHEPRGDRDGDADRDPADLIYFLLCHDGPNTSASPACECQDINDDGSVDLLDLAEFLRS